MALLVSFDKAATLLAKQVYGGATDDLKGMAMDALELALQEVEIDSHVISQEGSGTLTLTGANQYAISEIATDVLRIVKAKTSWAPVDVMRRAEFMEKFPDYQGYSSGIPRYLVLWENDSLYVWPDQSGGTLEVIYYKLMEHDMGGAIMAKLLVIARKFAEADKDTRGVNMVASAKALDEVHKAQTRASDVPIRFLVEPRVQTINQYKRERG